MNGWTSLRPRSAAPVILAVGVLMVGAANILLWRRDRARAYSRLARPAPPALDRTPPVSILVAAWNERDNLQAFVRAFCALRYPNVELILCAGGSDGTLALARSLARAGRITVVEQQAGEGKQRALQHCFELASGEVIFLTDADCILDDASFEGTLSPILNDGESVATGGSAPLPAQRASTFVLQQWFADLYSRSTWGETTSGLLGRNAALTRPALAAIGAFSESVATGTDYHMAKQLAAHNQRIRVADSQVVTQFTDSVRAYRRQQSRWLRNVVLHGTAAGETREVVLNLAPSLIGAAMLLLPLSALWVGPSALTLWAVAFTHAVLSRARYCRYGELITGQPFNGYLQLPILALLDFAVWAAVVPDYLQKRARQQW
jgi:cellulose synthase/poly-beta-1,6-N-acetylglucosamine synthase-like glycosyltransferase